MINNRIVFSSSKGVLDSLFEDDRIEIVDNIDEVKAYLEVTDEFILDIETGWKYDGLYNYAFAQKWGRTERNPNAEGLDPLLSKIIMIQVGYDNVTYVVDVREFGTEWIKTYLEDESKIVIAQNAKFEYKHFKAAGITISNLKCTKVAEQVLYTGRSLDVSLAGMAKRYCGATLDKTIRLEFGLWGDKPFKSSQVIYGAEDIIYPAEIWEEQKKELISKDVNRCFDLEMRFLPVLADIETNGMHFNQQLWLENYEVNKEKLDRILFDLDDYVVRNYIHTKFVDRQYDMFSDGFKCNVSWSSQKQVVQFFKYLGIKPEDKGKPSLNAKILRSYFPQIKDGAEQVLFKKFIEYKELAQATTTFGSKYLKYIHPLTGRLHSNYNQVLNTGRISSSAPNLQNIPAGEGFRKAFDSPEGWNIVNADYSGQEQIILANKSQDKGLQSFYLDGHSDMHSFVASKIYPELSDLPLDEIKKNHKGKRQIAKAAGFAINYGGTGYTIAKNLGIPEEEGNKVYDQYFRAFPGLRKYFDRVQRQSLAQGYILIDPITRRKNWFRKPSNNRERGAIKRNALNYPIQGEAGGITKLAPILFNDWIVKNGYQDKVLITNLVHDEINIECTSEVAIHAARALEEAMQQAADIWCKTIKLSADAVVTTYWNH